MRRLFILAAGLIAASAVSAETYTYTTDADTFDFSQISDYIKAEYSQPNFVFDDTVDLVLNSDYAGPSESYVKGLGGLTLNSLELNGKSRINLIGENGKVTRIGTLTVNQSTQQWGGRFHSGHWVLDNINAIQDGYDPNAGISLGEAGAGAMQSLKVTNDIVGRISQFRVGSPTGMEYSADRWETPDIDVGGKISSTTTFTHYFVSAANGSGQFYYKVGALDQSVNMDFQSRMPEDTSYAYVNYMITGGKSTNGGSAVMEGNLTTSIFQNGVNKPVLTLFMNSSDGEFTQIFSGSSLKIEGGVTVMSGTLLVNFKETSGVNHGDLTMEGGRFGSSNTAGGSFLFTDLVYSGGTIELALDSAEAFDSLRLSGTVQLVDGFDGKVSFDFGDNLAWLIDSEENGGKGVKVIAWAAGTVGADSFAANSYAGEDGLEYVADFTSEADGLYVKYVAVPEPSTVAALMGVLALAFAAHRRRR